MGGLDWLFVDLGGGFDVCFSGGFDGGFISVFLIFVLLIMVRLVVISVVTLVISVCQQHHRPISW